MSIASTLIALPYEVARFPLATLDRRLTHRLAEGSAPRLRIDRAVGSVDQLAGAVLHNDDIARRGAERIDRSARLAEAVRLEAEAEAARQAAHDLAVAGREKAARKRDAAARKIASAPAEAERTEERGKQRAAASAAKEAAAKKAAAAKQAADRSEAVEQRKRRVDADAERTAKAARDEVAAQLRDAKESKKAAAEAREDAKVLDDLTEAKKQDRRGD